MHGLPVPRALRLLSRQLGVRRDPLRRIWDRLEGFVLLLLLLAGVVAVLLAGSVAARTHGYAERLATAQAAERHQVDAVVLTDAQPSLSDGSVTIVTATWQAAGSRSQSGSIEVPAGVRAGDHQQIWTDATGSVVERPMTPRDALGLAIAAAVGILLAATLALLWIYRVARWLIDRARLSDWDLDWARTAPLWTNRSR